MNTTELEQDLKDYIGLDQTYHSLGEGVLVTNGVMHFMEVTNSIWWWDIVNRFLYPMLMVTHSRDPLLELNLGTVGKLCHVKVIDDSDRMLVTYDLGRMEHDIPEGIWKFWLQPISGGGHVMMLPQEH